MFGFHVELGGHLVAVIALHIVVEGLVVAADAAPDTCGVGGENGGYLWQFPFHVEKTHSCSPLVEVGHHAGLIFL